MMEREKFPRCTKPYVGLPVSAAIISYQEFDKSEMEMDTIR